ncbi:MAG: hypothetical protein EXS13_13435 [Planctomycetes bacterium]|nr:hypothetical protein [Planctomycetota bacterium]
MGLLELLFVGLGLQADGGGALVLERRRYSLGSLTQWQEGAVPTLRRLPLEVGLAPLEPEELNGEGFRCFVVEDIVTLLKESIDRAS